MSSTAQRDVTDERTANEAMRAAAESTATAMADATATATTLLTVGAAPSSSGANLSLYPDWAPWPYPHYRLYPDVHTHVRGATPEQPHETVTRALQEIASATRALRESAEAMGVPVDGSALEEALVAKLRAALRSS